MTDRDRRSDEPAGTANTTQRNRGQLVLLAAVVIALALVPLAIAYFQLGYVGDVESEPAVETGTSGATAVSGPASDRAVHDALERTATANLESVAGKHDWANRSEAATIYRSRLGDDLDEMAGLALDEGVILTARLAPATASRWASDACPGGRNRAFGECVADDGIVLQERADTATIVAVAIAVQITHDDGTHESTIVISMPG